MLRMGVKFFSLTPGAPSHFFPPPSSWARACRAQAGAERRFHFSLCLNRVQICRKCTTDYLWPICGCTTRAFTSYTQRSHRRQPSFRKKKKKKTGLRASSKSASGCPWRTSRLDPPGWSKQGGAPRRFIWMVDNFCTIIQAARVPTESTCHCLKSIAAWQWHCGVVFIWYSQYSGVVLRKYNLSSNHLLPSIADFPVKT